MVCEHCHGTGMQMQADRREAWPCLSCGGCGFGHCCEGMVGGPYEEAAQSASSWGTTNPTWSANWEDSITMGEQANWEESTSLDEQANTSLDEQANTRESTKQVE